MNQSGPKGALAPTTYLATAAILMGAALRRGADAAHVQPANAAANAPMGIALDYQDTAERPVAVAHRPGEIVAGRSGAAFAVDAKLTADAQGRLITAAAGNSVWAIAREAATAADQLVSVELAAPGLLA